MTKTQARRVDEDYLFPYMWLGLYWTAIWLGVLVFACSLDVTIGFFSVFYCAIAVILWPVIFSAMWQANPRITLAVARTSCLITIIILTVIFCYYAEKQDAPLHLLFMT